MIAAEQPRLDAPDTRLLEALSRASLGRAETYLAAARDALERLIADPRLLDGVRLERREAGYTRTLLFGDAEISVWAMLWTPGARTSIHDHHCSCCFALYRGALDEIRFQATGEGEAAPIGAMRRRAGAIACLLPSGEDLHQMVNEGAEDAVSIHIYGFDHRRRPSSIRRQYRPVPRRD